MVVHSRAASVTSIAWLIASPSVFIRRARHRPAGHARAKSRAVTRSSNSSQTSHSRTHNTNRQPSRLTPPSGRFPHAAALLRREPPQRADFEEAGDTTLDPLDHYDARVPPAARAIAQPVDSCIGSSSRRCSRSRHPVRPPWRVGFRRGPRHSSCCGGREDWAEIRRVSKGTGQPLWKPSVCATRPTQGRQDCLRQLQPPGLRV